MKRGKRWAILVMVFAVAFSAFGGTAWSASTRYALVTAVTGTVKVTKAGGSKEIRVFNGMGLNEGDTIKVSKGGSLTLKVADQEDEVVLGENWTGTLSKLKESAGGGKETAFKTWAGSMYNKVQKLTGSNDTYRVETPTAVMGVRGTQFLLVFDPVTGAPKLVVNSGIVSAGQSAPDDGEEEEDTVVVLLPSQQIDLLPRTVTDDLSTGVSYADTESLVQYADASVIEQLLKNKQDIDQENDELFASLSEGGETPGNTTLDLTDADALQRYRQNVQNTVARVLKTVADTGKISATALQQIIDEVNAQIASEDQRLDPNKEVPDLDPTAGVDPAAEQRRQEARAAAQQRQQQRQQQQEERRQEFVNNNQTALEQAQQQKQQQQQTNEQTQQQRQQEAVGKLLNQLSEEERQRLSQQIEQRREEQDQQQQSSNPPPSTETNTETETDQNPPPTVSLGLGAAPQTTVYGQMITYTATASPSGTTGTTVFREGTVVLGQAALSQGSATLTKSDFEPGQHTVTAALGSTTSGAVTVTVNKANAAVVVTKTAASTSQGQSVTFHVTVSAVSPGTGIPAGTVKLYDGSVLLDTKTLSDAGTAAFAVSSLEAGTRSIKAVYDGNTRYAAGESVSLSHMVHGPKLAVAKSDSGDLLVLDVKLSHLVEANRVFGVQLHFVHHTNLAFHAPLGNDETYYNDNKFAQDKTVEHIKTVSGTVDGVPRRETIYTLLLFNGADPVAFVDNELLVSIPFVFSPAGGSGTDGQIELSYVQLVDEDGDPIEVEYDDVTFHYAFQQGVN